MAVTALIISIAALFASGLSAYYARRQAKHAGSVAAIETAKERRDRTPRLAGRIDVLNPDPQLEGDKTHRLWLRLESSETLDGLSAEITSGQGVTFNSGVAGVDPSGNHPKNATWKELLAMHEACWRVDLSKNRSDRIHLGVRCWARKESWTIPVTVDVPR